MAEVDVTDEVTDMMGGAWIARMPYEAFRNAVLCGEIPAKRVARGKWELLVADVHGYVARQSEPAPAVA
jgi:hypothetical protein